ncbi:DUF4115 domain-containing protein [Burkholderia sp. WAC0059]|uniref:helix-turn-helix domain-containing protein n=1 Tax=Burkholderia sp. WAC0059 TaxID=2066022 RepID=UPI000C7EA070|nr:helix-turn-helix domain-containing protein [Burkholderia sp. WAC0059]PLZ02736.1 DUF4115 domain-containing protein [Burkholderia sp. WAC0059]
MSEPQQPYGTDTNAGRPAQGAAPSQAQPVDSLAAMGARFTQLREAKGWSIDDVSARLKVSVSKLRSLETGDLSQLPDTTFVLGIVRSYAKMLDADPAPFIQLLRRERGIPQPDLSMPASAGADLPRGRVSLSLGGNSPKRHSWLWGIAVIVIAVIALAMWRTNSIDSAAWFARLKATAADATSAARHEAAASSTVVEGQTTPGTAAGASNASAPSAGASDAATPDTSASAPAASDATAAAPAASETATVQPQLSAPDTEASASADDDASDVAAAPGQAQPAASEPAVAAVATLAASASATEAPASAAGAEAASGASTFSISATQDTWISVRQANGKEVFSGLLHNGDSHDVSGAPPLKVTVGNKTGIGSMTFDGQPVSPSKYASARGNVARFTLP